MRLKLLVIVFAFLLMEECYAQARRVSFAELPQLQRKESRPVLVYIYTDWCNYCQAMKQKVLNDKEVRVFLDQNYYVVLLNAEGKEAVYFNGRTFRFKPTGTSSGIHELAEALGTIDGRNTFPTLCFLNRKNDIIYQHGGFLNPPSFLKLLKTVSQHE